MKVWELGWKHKRLNRRGAIVGPWAALGGDRCVMFMRGDVTHALLIRVRNPFFCFVSELRLQRASRMYRAFPGGDSLNLPRHFVIYDYVLLVKIYMQGPCAQRP